MISNFKWLCLSALLIANTISVNKIPFDPQHAHAYCGRDLEKANQYKAEGIDKSADLTKPTRIELNNHRLYFLYAGPCEQPYCSFERNRQCGEDGKWYLNKCHMHAENVLKLGKECDMNDQESTISERVHDVKILRDYHKEKAMEKN